ncbi:MAG TPA: hypothetical protein PLF13_12485 [candidate division Zixibacteria bacterium]|nr:hypothetical protein [candidate division Zixibacteria bacterium]
MDKNQDRFEILRELALGGAQAEDMASVARIALGQAARLVGLNAAALFLFDDKMEPVISVNHAVNQASRETLEKLESELLSDLRKKRQLLSAYMSFGGETPYHSFTLPLTHGGRTFGAVIGLQEGKRTLIAEDGFLEALAALLALSYAAGDVPELKKASEESYEKYKLEGIREVAVTANHEINGIVMAIMGHVRLLLDRRSDLDDELVQKLKTIEKSAEKISDVTWGLSQIKKVDSINYGDGIVMQRLPKRERPSDQDK